MSICLYMWAWKSFYIYILLSWLTQRPYRNGTVRYKSFSNVGWKLTEFFSWTENWEEAVKLLFPQYVSGKYLFMEHFRVISVLISNARPEKLKDEKPFQTINEHQNTASIAWKKKSCYHQMKEINVFMSEKLHNILCGTCTNKK